MSAGKRSTTPSRVPAVSLTRAFEPHGRPIAYVVPERGNPAPHAHARRRHGHTKARPSAARLVQDGVNVALGELFHETEHRLGVEADLLDLVLVEE